MLAALIIISSLAMDIITKYLVVNNISYGEHNDYMGGFFRITLLYNDGGVFGILKGHKNLFLIVSIIVLIMMVVYYIYEKSKDVSFHIAMSLIIGGALGNILDRVIPGRPGVVDFLSVGVDGVYRWPAFNIADSVIVIGAILLVIVFYREEKALKKNN